MKWVRDNTGRFPQRPYYDALELDFECENLISSFLIEKYGKVEYPVSTNDLTILIEQKTSELDLYADLICFLTEHKPEKFDYKKDNLRTLTSVKGRELEQRFFIHLVAFDKWPSFGSYQKP